MGDKRLDLMGQRFGRLTVIAAAKVDRYQKTLWLCRCDCGKEVTVRGAHLRSGSTSSCGCWHRTVCTLLKLKHGHARAGSATPEYSSWCNMIQRCTNPKSKDFADWGGRGIRVCDRWRSFENFLADMGRKPSPDLSIERRDNEGNYEPLNCYWATRSEQNKNQRARKAA